MDAFRAPNRVASKVMDGEEDDPGGLWANIRQGSDKRTRASGDDGESLEDMIRAAWRSEGPPNEHRASGEKRDRFSSINPTSLRDHHCQEAPVSDLPIADLDIDLTRGLSRRGYDNEGLLERRASCAACRRTMEASGVKEGIRCGGCRR